jgi:hypothetical protein
MIIKEYFQFIFPFILITLIIYAVSSWTNLGRPKEKLHKLIVLIISAFISFVPFTGLSLAEYFLSINPNYSIGSLALVFVLLWPQFVSRSLLSDNQLRIFCLWNVVLSLALFSSYLGLIPYDMYALGYNFSIWFIIMALLTVIIIWRWLPLSFIFIAYIAAFNLRLLPSHNFFDYITDGFLLIMSLGMLASLVISSRRLSLKGRKI